MAGKAAQHAADFNEASDVTHSTAYNALNVLVDEGLILEERADYLKQKFKDLHSRVLTIYKRDNILLKRARQLRSELDRERAQVQARGDVAKKDDEEIQKLKRTLIALEKELNDAQEHESILQVEALEYDRRRQNLILEREDAQAAEEARLRPKMEAVQAEIAEMGNKIKDLIDQHTELQRTLEQTVEEEATCRAEMANFTATLAQARQQYTNVEHEPERAEKQLQLVDRSLLAAKKELGIAEEKSAAQVDAIAKLEQQKSSRSTDMNGVCVNLERIKSEIEAKRKTLAAINASLEMELEARDGYHDRLTELEKLLKTTKISAQQEDAGVERMRREKARCVKEFAAIEQAREDHEHEQQSLKEQLVLVQKNLDQLEATRRQTKLKIEEGRKKCEVRARQLLREQSKEKEFSANANLVLEDIAEAVEREAERAQQHEVKRRELLALVSRRQEMNREAAAEGSRVVLAKNEVVAKSLQLRELKHRREEMEKRLAALMENFQTVKQERSQRTALIQAITQKMTEVSEKTKILENELEVLVREAAVKEQELIKKKRLTHEAQQAVVKLRLEKNKQRKRSELALDAEKEVRAQVKRMNLDIAATEDVMVELKETYLAAIETRNQTGIQLIDRNDTLSLLVEKVKAQEVAIVQGTTLTNARAEEVKHLKIRLADLLRAIEACQKSIPKVKQLEEELERVTSEMDDERWRVEVLEGELSDPNNPRRWRHLEKHSDGLGNTADAAAATGSRSAAAPKADATTAAAPAVAAASVADSSSGAPSEEFVRLQARTQDIENRLNAVNARLREKELILAEVRELSDRIGAQAESGRDFTLVLARQMNQYQGGIRAKTRQMMATISELSLFQASSIQLQQEVERLEAVVQEAEQRLEQGDAPFAEAAEEYERQRESNARYAETLRRKRDESREAALVGAHTVITTAEPRANAYVPADGLGLPKPFGSHAPFKPTVAPLRTPHGSGRQQQARLVSRPVPDMAATAAAGPSPSLLTSQNAAAAAVPSVLRPESSHGDKHNNLNGQKFSHSVPPPGRLRAGLQSEEGLPDRSSAPLPVAEQPQLRLSQRNLSASQQ